MKFLGSVANPEAAVLAAAKDMLRRGLVEGTAGNISARREDGNLVITPSSVDYSDMKLEDLVLVRSTSGVPAFFLLSPPCPGARGEKAVVTTHSASACGTACSCAP